MTKVSSNLSSTFRVQEAKLIHREVKRVSEVDKEVKHHFDEMSGQYYDVVDATPFIYGYYHAKELSSIRSFLTSFLSKIDSTRVGDLRILDIGCATGRIIGHLQGAAPASLFVGVDLSREMIRLAKKTR